MKKLILILFIIHCSFLIAKAQVQQEWVARYNGIYNLDDRLSDIAIDSLGNILVTGSTQGPTSQSRITTIKYNQLGEMKWIRDYLLTSYPYGIAVDGSGCVYVTGQYVGAGTNDYDIVTIKYDSLGTQLWVRFFTSQGNNPDAGYKVCVFQNHVYVAGRYAIPPYGSEYVLLKYDLNGLLQWASISNYNNILYDMKISETTGMVYLTGVNVENGTYRNKFCTMKYDTTGVLRWQSFFDTLGYGSRGFALDIDSNDNLFVTGESYKSPYSYDYHMAVIKLDSSGELKWYRLSHGPFNMGERGHAIKVDKLGNTVTTGFGETVSGLNAYLTAKYNSFGDSIFENRFTGNGGFVNIANDIDIDSTGSIYITGQSTGVPPTGNNDIATIKYSRSGELLWVQWYNSPLNGSDYGRKIKVDNMGDVYVGGFGDQTQQSFIFDYITIKYSVPIGVRPISNEIPINFCLYQNYPNPFNSSSKFKVFITSDVKRQTSNVKVIVYDVIGREIIRLIDENLKPGEYEITFDAKNLPSGVYFYSLFAEGRMVDTKKMIILK